MTSIDCASAGATHPLERDLVMKNIFKHFFIASSIFLITTSASASITITGNGSWNSDATSSDYSAPNANWHFSFVLPNPLSSNTTTSITSFVYQLDGIAVVGLPLDVEFFDVSDRGLFDLQFDGFTIALYGSNVYNEGTLSAGAFSADIEFLGDSLGTGDGTGEVIIGTVPEPSIHAYFLVSLALFAAINLRTKRATLDKPQSEL